MYTPLTRCIQAHTMLITQTAVHTHTNMYMAVSTPIIMQACSNTMYIMLTYVTQTDACAYKPRCTHTPMKTYVADKKGSQQ